MEHLHYIWLTNQERVFRLTGEYHTIIDDKGRVKLPAGLSKQLVEQGVALHFMINRGFEKCLILYPKTVWDQKAEVVDRLNIYDPVQRNFVRYFYRGATGVMADNAERILIPKSLTDHAGVNKEIILFAYLNQIELWDAKNYEAQLANEPSQFSDLAAQVFGNSNVLIPQA